MINVSKNLKTKRKEAGEHNEMVMPIRLRTVTLDNGKTYFIDERLKQLRNVENPSDYINLRMT